MRFRNLLIGSAMVSAMTLGAACSSSSTTAVAPPPPPPPPPAPVTTSSTSSSTSTSTITRTEPDGTVVKETTVTTMNNGRIQQKQVTTTYEYPAR